MPSQKDISWKVLHKEFYGRAEAIIGDIEELEVILDCLCCQAATRAYFVSEVVPEIEEHGVAEAVEQFIATHADVLEPYKGLVVEFRAETTAFLTAAYEILK